MLTWASPRLARWTPIARTAGSPPPDSRTRRAMARAAATSAVASTALKATRKKRAPITVAPAVGWTRAGPKSGAQAGSASFAGQPLEAAAADLRKGRPLRPPRRPLVEVDREPEAPRHLRREPLGRRHRRRHRRIPQGDERHHVHRAHPRVNPLMPGEVDLGERRLVERAGAPGGAPPARRPGSAPNGCGRDRTRRRAAAPPASEDAAAASRATTSGRRPSLTLGTHSRAEHGCAQSTVGRRKHPLLRYGSIFQNQHESQRQR